MTTYKSRRSGIDLRTVVAMEARIEALEAALLEIANWPPSSRVDDIINAFIDARLCAKAALAPEQNK